MEWIDKKVLCVWKNYKLQEAIRGYREEVFLSLEMDLFYNCWPFSLEKLEDK